MTWSHTVALGFRFRRPKLVRLWSFYTFDFITLGGLSEVALSCDPPNRRWWNRKAEKQQSEAPSGSTNQVQWDFGIKIVFRSRVRKMDRIIQTTHFKSYKPHLSTLLNHLTKTKGPHVSPPLLNSSNYGIRQHPIARSGELKPQATIDKQKSPTMG